MVCGGSPRFVMFVSSLFSVDVSGHTRQKWISRIFLVGGRTTRRLWRAWETMIDKIRHRVIRVTNSWKKCKTSTTRASEAFLFSSSTRGMTMKKETGLAGSYDFSCWAHEEICMEGFCSSPGGGRLQPHWPGSLSRRVIMIPNGSTLDEENDQGMVL